MNNCQIVTAYDQINRYIEWQVFLHILQTLKVGGLVKIHVSLYLSSMSQA